MKKLRMLLAGALALPLSAVASVPKVAVDINPLHSLVAQVMSGVGEPELLVQSGASPHGYSLSPSEAEALEDADLVFWVGEPLEPWLENSLETLGRDARVIEMLEVPGTTTHAFREGATFEGHHHHGGEEDSHQEDESHHHDEHADHHEEHDHHDHGHHHEGLDPHAWLDPANARLWLEVIADELSGMDPENADQYARNAKQGKQQIAQISAGVEAKVEALGDLRFIVFHDAYQYFEKRFGIEAAGAISIGDASDPGPARVREIRELVKTLNVRCVFTEPQYNPDMVNTVFGGTGVNTSAVMDPLGAHLEPGPALYPQLLEGIAGSLDACMAKAG